MTKDSFKVVRDETTGYRYVVKVVDEETKNHKLIDNEITSGSSGRSRISHGGVCTH